MQTLTCFLSKESSYTMHIEAGTIAGNLAFLKRELKEKQLGRRYALITDERVAALYGEKLCRSLSSDLAISLFTFPSGEIHKTRKTKEKLEDQLLSQGFGRDSCILALGGGVVTDLAGFLASTYCRGVPLILLPTTLLAMVDASIGGKTGVNTSFGKNLIGSFYQPQKVYIDPLTLKTLPQDELKNGIVEMIKHGLVASSSHFCDLEAHCQAMLACDPCTLERTIFDSIRLKKEIVEEDEREAAKRHLLNFGHTIAHALELLSDYSLPHGAAVALGILVEGHLSCLLGHLDPAILKRLYQVFKSYDLPLKLPTFSLEKVLAAMRLDKKSSQGQPRFVLLKAIGQPLIEQENHCHLVAEELVAAALNQVTEEWDAVHRH